MNDNSSVTNQWLAKATKQLEAAGIGTARLDALVLLSDVTGKDRTHLLAHPELELTGEQQKNLEKLLERRSGHEPLAYIRGRTEFYGREFIITSAVLEPRPESETMIEQLRIADERLKLKTIVDVGTGSGALAITAALHCPEATIFAVDVDKNCLKVASENANKHAVSINLLQSDLLKALINEPLVGPTAVLANLPYVPDDYQINEAALKEPSHAIFGGKDGLDLYRVMFAQLHEHFRIETLVFTESLPFQHTDLQKIAATHGFQQIARDDFIQVFRKRTI